MSPPADSNQCVAGALATWALMHTGDPRWNHPSPLDGNAIDLFGVAHAQGFQVSSQPAPGELVVYGSSYGVFGHIATVVAVQPDRYEVIEQNFLDLNPNLEPHWETFDLWSVAWPDAAVVGFVVGPPFDGGARMSTTSEATHRISGAGTTRVPGYHGTTAALTRSCARGGIGRRTRPKPPR